MNAFARGIRDTLLRSHPEWAGHTRTLADGELEVKVPAPEGSRAAHLVIATARGSEIRLRLAPRHAHHPVGSEAEMRRVIAALLEDEAFLAVVTSGDDWIQTSLLRPGEELVLANGQVANVFSWSGKHDRIVTPPP